MNISRVSVHLMNDKFQTQDFVTLVIICKVVKFAFKSFILYILLALHIVTVSNCCIKILYCYCETQKNVKTRNINGILLFK